MNKENTTILLVNSNQCETDNNSNNNEGDSNANRHVRHLPGLHAQLIGSNQVSAVNGMTRLTKTKIIATCFSYLHVCVDFKDIFYGQTRKKGDVFRLVGGWVGGSVGQ